SFADAAKHPQVRLEQRKQALGPVLVHLPARVFLLRMVNKVVPIALERVIAAGRVRRELTARVDREVGGLLHRLDRKVPRRLDHDTALAAHPGDDRRLILVIVAPPGLAFLRRRRGWRPNDFLPPVLAWPLCPAVW